MKKLWITRKTIDLPEKLWNIPRDSGGLGQVGLLFVEHTMEPMLRKPVHYDEIAGITTKFALGQCGKNRSKYH